MDCHAIGKAVEENSSNEKASSKLCRRAAMPEVLVVTRGAQRSVGPSLWKLTRPQRGRGREGGGDGGGECVDGVVVCDVTVMEEVADGGAFIMGIEHIVSGGGGGVMRDGCLERDGCGCVILVLGRD